MAVDGRSRLYVASWRGGQFRYGGEQIGYLARVTRAGATPPPAPDLTAATDARLVDLVASDNQTHRRFAQQALLRRGRSPERIALLEQRVLGTGFRRRARRGDVHAEAVGRHRRAPGARQGCWRSRACGR